MNTKQYVELLAARSGSSNYRLALDLGVSQQAMSNYKLGQREADDEIAAKFAEYLELPPAAVIADLKATKAEADGNSAMANIWRNVEAMALGKAPPVVRKVASPVVRVVPLPMVASTGTGGGAAAPAMASKRSPATAHGGLKIRRGNPS